MSYTETQDFIGACGHVLPHFPVHTEEHTYCSDTCRREFEPEWDKEEDDDAGA